MRNQKGMTLIGWVGVLAVILLFALAALRLLPVYMQYFKISSVLRDVPVQMKTEGRVDPKAIRGYISKRFDIESINVISPQHVAVDREGEYYLVKVDYEHKVTFIGNISFLVSFEKDVKVTR